MILALAAAFVAVGVRFIFDYEYIPNLIPVESVKSKYFDYIIIGAGTAGSVLAYELSKHSNYTVLLIEAGGIFNGLSIVPIASTLMQGTKMDWSFNTVPQKYSSRGLTNQRQAIPRGKGLGGSHQLNYLLHFNGLKEDFDEWARLGADGWNYNELKNFLNRHELKEECKTRCPDNDDNYCELAANEPKLSITPLESEHSMLTKAFIKADKELMKSFHRNVSLILAKFTTRNGIRRSVFHEYLRRAFKHKNLSIMIHAKVEKIEFNKDREAISVIVATKSQSTRINVNREIILSAGAIHSPQLLKLSGVADESELKSVGINLIHHLPQVGENLFDHMNFPLFVSINETASVTMSKVFSASEILHYLIDGTGVLATTAVIGFGKLTDFGFILFGMGTADEESLKNIANYETSTFRAFFPFYGNPNQEGLVMLSTCLLPKSRGSIKLNPKNLRGEPLIDPEYLKVDSDMECMRNATHMVMKLIKTEAFQKIGAKIHWPKLKACENFGPFTTDDNNFSPSDRYLDCLIRHAALTAHHPGGTCAIGAVVDNNLRYKL